jgi:hypothetical protein
MFRFARIFGRLRRFESRKYDRSNRKYSLGTKLDADEKRGIVGSILGGMIGSFPFWKKDDDVNFLHRLGIATITIPACGAGGWMIGMEFGPFIYIIIAGLIICAIGDLVDKNKNKTSARIKRET